MRKLLSILILAVVLGITVPAEAQLRSELPSRKAPTNLNGDSGVSGFLLNRLFSPDHFRMAHSYELSYGSFGGQAMNTGIYTNSLMWHLNQKFAARVDVGVMHSPFGANTLQNQFVGDAGGPRVFLQNAEFAYRPTENMTLHFSVRQSPYGSYMAPYGYRGSGFGYGFRPHGSTFNARFSTDRDGLFWNPDLR